MSRSPAPSSEEIFVRTDAFRRLLIACAGLWVLVLSSEIWRAVYHDAPMRYLNLIVVGCVWLLGIGYRWLSTRPGAPASKDVRRAGE